MSYGIDVAKWNGKIDWKKVRNDNKEFAILKATQKANNIEPSFEQNYKGSTDAGIRTGVYRYVYANSEKKAEEEAKGVLKVLDKRSMPLGIWLDMEDASIRGLGKSGLKKIIDTETNIFKNAGYNVGIYCNVDWYNNVLDGKTLSKHYPIWIARYGTNNGKLNNVYKPNVNNMAAWQYTSKGRVNGISNDVDLNIMYVDTPFNSTPSTSNKYYAKYTGSATKLDDILREIGAPFGNKTKRAPLAKANGISNYSGTLEQNIKLIELAKSGKLLKA